jgi:GntR family carbon starvation induced transcriptional regulator
MEARRMTKIAPAEGDAPDVPKSLAGIAYRKLYSEIVRGDLRPGARLGMAELQKRYQLGIGPIREALSRLSSENLVIAREQRGFIVAPMDREEIQDVLETRLVIEKEALRRSIENSDPAWEGEVLSAYHQLDKANPVADARTVPDEWSKAHRLFHMSLLAKCQSKLLLQFAGSLFDQSERSRLLQSKIVTPTCLPRIQNEHRQILEGVLDHDVGAAQQSLESHYRRTAGDLMRALDHGVIAARGETAED